MLKVVPNLKADSLSHGPYHDADYTVQLAEPDLRAHTEALA